MIQRTLAVLGLLALLAAPAALAQDSEPGMNHDEGGGGCVYDRQVYPQGAEICQGGARMRCDEGAWGEVGSCRGGPERAPVSEGGDEIDPED